MRHFAGGFLTVRSYFFDSDALHAQHNWQWHNVMMLREVAGRLGALLDMFADENKGYRSIILFRFYCLLLRKNKLFLTFFILERILSYRLKRRNVKTSLMSHVFTNFFS